MPKDFEKLRKHITKEYEQRGYSEKEATRIGYATAAKISREKKAR